MVGQEALSVLQLTHVRGLGQVDLCLGLLFYSRMEVKCIKDVFVFL